MKPLDQIILEPEEGQLLIKLAEAHKSLSREEQCDFSFSPAFTRVAGARPRTDWNKAIEEGGSIKFKGKLITQKEDIPWNLDHDMIFHPGLPNGSIDTFQVDIDALKLNELIQFRDQNHFFITPIGFAYFRHVTTNAESISRQGENSYSFPRLPIKSEEAIWLEEVYKSLRTQEEVDVRKLKAKLWKKIPNNFNPRGIDQRLLFYGIEPTLFGIWHVDPKTDLIDKTDKVIRCIRDLLLQDAERRKVAAEEVSALTRIPKTEVGIIFRLLGHLGSFWMSISGSAKSGYHEIGIEEEKYFDEYLQYEGIEPLMDRFFEKFGVQAKQPEHSYVEELATEDSAPCVFIGHGRSPLWARLKIFLENELALPTVHYESESRVGESIVPILEQMLNQATFAILILTAEDETAVSEKRARQNVVHEAGLFQGRLGFKKAILLRQDGLEDFSNVAGLQYIGFTDDRIEQTFYELQRVLRREGLI